MKQYLMLPLALAAALTLGACAQGTAATPPETETTPPGLERTAPTFSPAPTVSSPRDGEYDWGVTLAAGDVTPTGLTLTCTQSGGSPTGELQTGSYYSLEVLEGESWTAVEQLPQEYDVAWTAEAWLIPMEDSVQWTVGWEWLYGSLPAGTYRLGKEITDFRDSGDYDQQMAYVQFTVA